jgi:hypothetical protein
MSLLYKAGSLHANLAWLRKEGRLQAVMEHVPAPTLALMRNPPHANTWIDGRDIEPILCALEALDGNDAVLRMAREKLRTSILPPLLPMVSAVMRFFGTSPARMLRHVDDFVWPATQGMEFKYKPVTADSGIMDVHYRVERAIPMCMFISCMAPLELMLELCGVSGTVSEPERIAPASARFRIAWSP